MKNLILLITIALSACSADRAPTPKAKTCQTKVADLFNAKQPTCCLTCTCPPGDIGNKPRCPNC